MPSAILEESQEFSQEVSNPHGQSQLISQLQAAADEEATGAASHNSADPKDEEESQMEQVVEESQEDEDDAPVVKGGSRLRSRRKASSPPKPSQDRPRRGLRSNRAKAAEAGSDFEPDPEGEDEADVAMLPRERRKDAWQVG